MSPMQQMLLGSSGGVNAIDFIGMPDPSSAMRGSSTYYQAAYDSEGNIITWYVYNNFTLVKIKPDGTVDWKRGFSGNPINGHTFVALDVGYNDITVCMSYKANDGIYLWGVSTTGALLWNKHYHVDNSTYPTAGNTLTFANYGQSSIKAMTTGDVALIAVGCNDPSSSNGGTPQLNLLTVKCTDGTSIGWGMSLEGYNKFQPDRGFCAYLPSGSTTGYWSALSEQAYTQSGGSGMDQTRGWRMKGKFYTADHSGSKDIFIESIVQGMLRSGSVYAGARQLEYSDCDCLKESTGTNIDSVTTYVGNQEDATGTYKDGLIINNNWMTTNKKLIHNGHSSSMRVAKKSSDTYFVACNDHQTWQDGNTTSYKVVLTKIASNAIVWSRTLLWYAPGTSTQKNVWCNGVFIDPNGDKGFLNLNYNGALTKFIIAQFDTGDTAPATGTYTLSNTGKVTVSTNSTSLSGTETISAQQTTYTNHATWYAGQDFEFKTDTWASQTFEDKSVDFIKEDWD